MRRALRHLCSVRLRSALSGTALIATLGTACTAATSRSPSRSPTPVSEITREDIEHVDRAEVVSVYDVVRLLRPWMLTSQSLRELNTTGGAPPARTAVDVYLDDTWLGGIDALRSIPLRSVESVRWQSPTEAAAYRGSARRANVILVRTVRKT